jgi:hypothetical protein
VRKESRRVKIKRGQEKERAQKERARDGKIQSERMKENTVS